MNTDKPSARNTTLFGVSPSVPDSSIVAGVTGKNRYSYHSYNLNYKSTIDSMGQELTIDADYAGYNNSEHSTYNNVFYNASGGPYKPDYSFRIGTPATIHISALKVDYNYPVSAKMKLETGIKTSYVSTDNNYIFENYYDNIWSNDISRSNRFKYRENINAGYINLNQEFKAVTVQIGLRAEQTNSKGNSITENKIVDRHYFNLFPSISLNKTLSPTTDFGISYTRRIDRPDYSALNPFIGFVDLYTFQQGNPFLKPQYTNSFQLSYSYKKMINVSVGYSHTSDVISQALLTDTLHKTLYLTNENLADQQFYNIVLSAPVAVVKWWNMFNYITTFYSEFSSDNLLGAPFKSRKLTALLNTSQTFTISPSLSAELSANYQSAQVYGTYIIKPMYGVDLGISKTFSNNRFNLKFAANDVFNLRSLKIKSAVTGQDYQLKQKEESRIFRLSFGYRFGSNQIKSARERTRGLTDEESRIKTKN